MRALPLSRDRWLDCVFALVAAAIGVSSVLTPDPTVAYDYPPADFRLILLALAATLPIAVRRDHPYAALLVSVASLTTIGALHWHEGVTPLATVVLLYSIAVHRPFRVAVAGLLTVLGMFMVFARVAAPYFDDSAPALSVLSAVIFCIPWGIGLSVRRQRLLREEAMARAVAAERERAAAEERAVFAERLRIARELHDVVAHTLSVVTVQAGVARHLLEQQPDRAGPALAAIEEAGRDALEDLRRMLGLLRAAPEDDARDTLAPSPGMIELQALVALHRETHGPVELTIDPDAERMPDSVRVTVYRIVQEALTNARKHAPDSPVEIAIGARGGDVTILVDNQAPAGPAPAAQPGFGLVGMRERVGLFGGDFEAGLTQAGGFRVRAILPGITHGEALAT